MKAAVANQINNPTFILCRPRSRSTWLSLFLGGTHDPSAYTHITELGKYKVVVDTGLALHFGKLKVLYPKSNFFLLLRNKLDCLKSVRQLGYGEDWFYPVSNAVDSLVGIIPPIYSELLDDKKYLKNLYEIINNKECTDDYIREFQCAKIDIIPRQFLKEMNKCSE